MIKKTAGIIFMVLFFLMIAVPLCMTFISKEKIAVEQNRALVPPPPLFKPRGKINPSITFEFEAWINDHIGFRQAFVDLNGRLHYVLANRFPIDRPLVFGPKGELNYASFETIRDFQHKNRYPKAYLEKTADSLQTIGDYIRKSGAQFFYYQCWDKHSIYPEYFPDTVLQYGTSSKTDEVIETMRERCDLPILSPKEDLIAAKTQYDTYSVFGDPTHWTPRGARVGYLTLMKGINREASAPYRILTDDDYRITWTDQGLILYGSIHREDLLEQFELKDPKAQETREKLTLFAEDPRAVFYTNESAGNRSRLLIIGDSYFRSYLMDDIAESFYETIFFWGDHMGDLKAIVDAYEPDLVVMENAEREDRTMLINACAQSFR